MPITNFDKAKILNQALPYIKEFTNKTMVVKLGGSILEDLASPSFIHDIVLMKFIGINVVVVHGGGKNVSSVMGKLGKKVEFINGLRVTDPETMEITQMVLAGMNKDLVSSIQRLGGSAVGLSGKDSDLVVAKKLVTEGPSDLGRVGDIIKVNPTLLEQLISASYIPVISSVASSGAEQGSFNINADHFATEIATALKAEKLIFLSDVAGVLDMKNGKDGESELINKIPIGKIKHFIDSEVVIGGMIPKLRSAQKAIESGTKHVHFLSGKVNHSLLVELFTTEGIGTQIHS